MNEENRETPNRRPRRDNNRPKVAEWKTHSTIVNTKEPLGPRGPDLGLRIVVDQPIMENEKEGFKRLSASISVNDRFLRLNTKAFMALMDILSENRSAILDAYDAVQDYNTELRETQQGDRGNRQNNRNRPGGVGGGLSRFTPESKTEKKKKRRERERRNNND
jgi:hypothetical protein